ncbi:unnamed protein product [Angiostrongylus costaricensis]|uniref:Acyl-CoA synthetase n=1 Tax=Angiostrongylus costaricensis TaxID=334426 RepID=A0A0R3PGM9_ANGCS|nr:unnamed protein product [Angiostrongylus costaricensis]
MHSVYTVAVVADDLSAEKRISRFAFAKRSPYRQFAFAKRLAEDDGETDVEKRARFAFAKRSSPRAASFAAL